MLLEGGYNEEHEVSLSTGKEVKKAIKQLGYNFKTIKVNPVNFEKEITKYQNIDICFNALHGPFGEDGKVQKILDQNNIKYTHSSSESSKKAFNKNLTKIELHNTKVQYLDYKIFSIKQISKFYFTELYDDLGSFVIKPLESGSSFGVKIFKNKKEIDIFFDNFSNEIINYKNHNFFMVEPYINGIDLTVGVHEKNSISKSITVTEIISKKVFFDYEAKYSKGLSTHRLPALIPNNIYSDCLSYAKIVHDCLGCSGISRSDFLYDKNSGKLFFLEINTQPGLTPVSLFPEQLNYINISFVSLIDNLINVSL